MKNEERVELFLKMAATHGVAIVFSGVLLAYFLFNHYTVGRQQLKALQNNTEAMHNMTKTVATQQMAFSGQEKALERIITILEREEYKEQYERQFERSNKQNDW